ncbi:hypothetical protein SAMN05518672_10345 [Chitinophaga sp. CF118]|uniref:SRPBCC family protein n=1 Tax=Chitinophaga sp. CF118 TaxID=1884367 RepID=UPI0008E49F5F|nr:SRPBCC family protein [Chitinophaga sp. CF118]SFD74757.1 hypothetical protein SAMN05518672_10345 [Chitinophaga sp. CF118]
MIQQSYSVITNEVTREQMWQIMSNINDWKSWDDSVEFSELQGEFRPGSTFLLKPKGGPKVKIKLAEVKTGEYFKDLTVFPLAKMYGEHWYQNTPEGLKVTITMTMTGLLSGLWNKIVMKGIVSGFAADVQNLIAAAKRLN